MRSVAILGCLLLAACATEEGYRQRLNPLIGRTEADLVRAFGVPDSTYETGGLRFLQYEAFRVVTWPGSPGQVHTYRRNGRVYRDYRPGTPPSTSLHSCRTTWQLSQGRVQSYQFEGNDCRAPES